MKNKWLIASVLIVVLIGLCGASLFATWQGIRMAQDSGLRFRGFGVNRVSAQATEEKNLKVNGPANLNVENSFGNISVKAGPDGQVNVTAEKTAWGNNDADAQVALKDLKVVIKQDGDTIRVSVQQPADVDMLHIGPGMGSVKFTISVPQRTVATLHSSNGDVLLDGTTGDADVQSNFGDVTITNVTGDVLGKSNNGKVTALKLASKEKITLSSDFGAVTLDQATGSDVSVSSSNGRLDIKNVKASGLLKASSQFGSIEVADSQAKTMEFKSSNGGLKLENLDVDGEISAESNFGSLTLSEVDAKTYDLNTQNGKISLDGAQSTIKVHSDFGSIEVLNARDASIDLSSNNGAVTFSGSLSSGPHIIKSSFGNITILLPADSALNVELETDFGKIVSDFRIAISGEIDSKHWNGTINNGGATLTAKTNNGNITLHSSK
jgi:DUF4097 and DUF4098 domain-containing protein YvlB